LKFQELRLLYVVNKAAILLPMFVLLDVIDLGFVIKKYKRVQGGIGNFEDKKF